MFLYLGNIIISNICSHWHNIHHVYFRIALASFVTVVTLDFITDSPQVQGINVDLLATDSHPSRVFIWAVPRSVSTTLLISLSKSPDVDAWFEPYLFTTHMEIFRKSEESISLTWFLQMTLASFIVSKGYDIRDVSFSWVKQQLETNTGSRHIVVKEMVKGITGNFESIPDGYTHTFLIRHPLRVFASYKQKHNTEGSENKGLLLTQYSQSWIPKGYFFKEMYDLVHHIRDVLKMKVIIIDSDDLLDDPESVLKAYCRETGLSFSYEMLHWKPDSSMWNQWIIPKDTSFKWWYRSLLYGYNPTHKTSFSKAGFSEKVDLPEKVDDDVMELAEASMEYYNELYEQRLKYYTN